jgi:5-methylthioadenosine/S-adenosylhomocysteine deaminase
MKALIENGHVVTMDARRASFARGYVAIGDDGRIAAVGDMADRPPIKAGVTIDAQGMLVLPGLINAHTQPWHLLARGAAQNWDGDERGLLAVLEGVLGIADRAAAAQLYAAHMLHSGMTCVLGHVLSETSAADAAALIAPLRAAGLRQVFAKDFKSASAADEVAALAESFRADPRVGIAVALDTSPHHIRAGRSNERLIEAGYRTARDLGLRVSSRSSGDEGHATYVRDAGRAGGSHVMHLMELGVLDDSWLLAMPMLADETDISLMVEAGCHVVYTPTHDAFRGLPPGMLASMSRKVNCALGTGGPLFDPAEDMVEQMKACSMIQNSARLDPTVMPFETSLEMATINAARALGLDKVTGSLEPGKQADIAVFALDRIYAHVSHKPISTFIATGRGADADTVFVGGELLLRGGRIVSAETQAATARAAAAGRLPSFQPAAPGAAERETV